MPEPPAHLREALANRRFRWPDGTLRKEKPPYKREVFDARREWEDLVAYCRRTGGCADCTKGKCYLHGVGVSYEDHKAFCLALGVWNQPLEDMKNQVYAEEVLASGKGAPQAQAQAAA